MTSEHSLNHNRHPQFTDRVSSSCHDDHATLRHAVPTRKTPLRGAERKPTRPFNWLTAAAGTRTMSHPKNGVQ